MNLLKPHHGTSISNSANSSTSNDQLEDEKYVYDKPDKIFKIYVGIDFGTDGSGLAYALPDGSVYIHNLWKDVESTQKPKTSVLFDNYGNVQCHGNNAIVKYITSMNKNGWKLFERFKMNLYDHDTPWKSHIITSSSTNKKHKVDINPMIKTTNNSKMFEQSEKVFVAQLIHLKQEAIKFIESFCRKKRKKRKKKKKKKLNITENDIKWILTVPSIWSDKAKDLMKKWAIKAELIKPINDVNHIPNQLKIVYEPDCASLSIQHAILRNIECENVKNIKKKAFLDRDRPQINIPIRLKKGDVYILCDVGGGTCDVACHQIMNDHGFAIAEVLHPSGGPWGASNIDTQFELLLDSIFGAGLIEKFKLFNPTMYQQFLSNFILDSKTTFYDGIHSYSYKDYHEITMPLNLIEFLLDDINNNNDNKDYNYLNKLLDEKLKKKCQQLYQNNVLITITHYKSSYALSIHIKIWKMLFDVIIDPIIEHITKILHCDIMKQSNYIFIVGGFANSIYFQERMRNTFNRINVLIPQFPQLCVVDGAARYGLQPDFMKIRRLSYSYGIKINRLLSSISKENLNLFPPGYIHQTKYIKDTDLKAHIPACFNTFAVKDQAIKIDDKSIKKPVYRTHINQKIVTIEIYRSDKTNPMTCTSYDKCIKKGSFDINFENIINDINDRKLWIEFNYSDTILTVHAYPDGMNLKKTLLNKIAINYD